MASPVSAPDSVSVNATPDLKIRGVPTQIRTQIEQYARENGISLNQAVIDHLDVATRVKFEPRRIVIVRQSPKEPTS